MSTFDDWFAKMMPDAEKWIREMSAEPVVARPVVEPTPDGFLVPPLLAEELAGVCKITSVVQVPNELLMDYGPTIKSIADMLGSDWRPPKLKELHCHPDVANWLRLTTPEAKPEFPYGGSIGALTGIPVFEEPEFEDGNWELREDGQVVSSGHMDVPYLYRRIKIEFRDPQPFSMLRHLRGW